MMTDTKRLSRDVVEDVRRACEESGRESTEAEVRRALTELDAAEVERVRRLAREGLPGTLGPDALVDWAQGAPLDLALEREEEGWYLDQAEARLLETIRRHEESQETIRRHEESQETSLEEREEAPAPKKTRRKLTPEEKEEVQVLTTLFAYHRDAVLVAKALGVGMTGLKERIDDLGQRRKLNRLLENTTDIDLFSPEKILPAQRKSVSLAPVVRRRSEKGPEEAPPAPEDEPEAPLYEEEDSEPTIDTAPVNAHGTRVYRRNPESLPPRASSLRSSAAEGLSGRREYVREPRRRVRPVTPAKPARSEKVAPPTPTLQPFSLLLSEAGKEILESLLDEQKANPRVLVKHLSERFDGPGRALVEDDLRELLKTHGLEALFLERETANTRFLIGFHQGARNKLANALLMGVEGELDAYLSRLGLREELERTRAERAQAELGRQRLHDRLVQVLTRAPYLDDLGVLPVIDREVKETLETLLARHPDKEDVRQELGLEPNGFAKLLRRYGLETGAQG